MSRAVRQLKATLASSESSTKREIFSPDWSCTTAFRARPSTLCSQCSDEGVPSLSVHDSTLPSESGLFLTQPCLHMSPKSGDWLWGLQKVMYQGLAKKSNEHQLDLQKQGMNMRLLRKSLPRLPEARGRWRTSRSSWRMNEF